MGEFFDFEDESKKGIIRTSNYDFLRFKNVCYLDVLGFTSIIEKKKSFCTQYDNGDTLIKMKFLGKIINKYKENLLTNWKKDIDTIMISDGIYIFFDDDTIDEVFHLISLIILYGALTGFYYRGAISDKEMVYSCDEKYKSLFLGKGIIQSYEMERFLSRYPRVIVDLEHTSKYIIIDNDGMKMFDFLEAIEEYYDDIYSLINAERDIKNIMFSTCEQCISYEECIKVNLIQVLPNKFNEIKLQLLTLGKKMKSKYKENKKIYSKYYEYINYMEGKSNG